MKRSLQASATLLVLALSVSARAQGAPDSHRWVHVATAAEGVLIERWDGGGWVFACAAPCDVPLPAQAMYRIAGDVRSSAPFVLDEGEGRVELEVDAASSAGRAAAITMVALGGTTLVAAGFMGLASSSSGGGEGGPWTALVLGVSKQDYFGYSSLLSSNQGRGSSTEHDDQSLLIATAVAGAVITIGGAIVMARSSSSKVTGPIREVEPPTPPRRTREREVTEWQSAGKALPKPAPGWTVPILSGTF